MSDRVYSEKERIEICVGVLATKNIKLVAEIKELRELVRDLYDRDDCTNIDHHGYCQTHGWLTEGECADARARKYFEKLKENEE